MLEIQDERERKRERERERERMREIIKTFREVEKIETCRVKC